MNMIIIIRQDSTFPVLVAMSFRCFASLAPDHQLGRTCNLTLKGKPEIQPIGEAASTQLSLKELLWGDARLSISASGIQFQRFSGPGLSRSFTNNDESSKV
jgi:hypothetical protein